MPAYPWLVEDALDYSDIGAKIEVMQILGVPYEEGYAAQAEADLTEQAKGISAGLAESGINVSYDRQIVAIIAYMQRLGTDIKADAEYVKRYERMMTRVDAGAAFSNYWPLKDAESLAAGKAIFEAQANLCYTCHLKDLGGQIGPNLTDDMWVHGCGTGEIMQNIKGGFPQKGMLPYGSGKRLSDEELHQVASYILSMRGTSPANPKAPDAARATPCDPELQ